MEKGLYYSACVEYALHSRKIEENDFENTNLRVYHRAISNPDSVFKALAKGGIIIPVVSGEIFNSSKEGMATVLVSVSQQADEDSVTLFNPIKSVLETHPTDEFMNAWLHEGGRCTTAFNDDGTYKPKLFDLTYVSLPDDLNELMEAMAENAHDMWALERQSEGWTYGPTRSDELLQTPDMVPYAQLPESEKQYDRVMAQDTLKLLTALGYRIVKGQ